MWVIFHVPTPTSDGQTAQDLYEKRVRWFTPEMKASAREHGCLGRAFYEQWELDAEPGEEAIILDGDIGLVPLP